MFFLKNKTKDKLLGFYKLQIKQPKPIFRNVFNYRILLLVFQRNNFATIKSELQTIFIEIVRNNVIWHNINIIDFIWWVFGFAP